MRTSSVTLGAWLAAATFFCACGGDDAAVKDTDGGKTGGGGRCESGVTLTGVVKEFEPKLERQKFKTVGGVRVCVFDHKEVPCVETASSGAFTLCGVPTDSEVMISFQKTGYAKALRMMTTRDNDYDILAETAIGTLALGIAQADAQGLDLGTLDGGAIQFFAAEPANGVLQVALLGDYTAELLDLDGNKAKCFGPTGKIDTECMPLYLDAEGEPDTTLKAATTKGVGAFGNVPPGRYRLRISHPDLLCDQHLPETGWRTDEDDEVEVESVDEWITSQAGVFCQPGE